MFEDSKLAELLLKEVQKERRYRYVRMFFFGLFMAINMLIFLTIRSGLNSSESGNISERIYKVIHRGYTADKKEEAVIAILPLYGTIGMTTSGSNIDISEEIVKMALERIRQNPKIKAVVLKIQSPGGAVLPTDKIYQMLKERLAGVKLVTYVDGLAASGGYYLALAGENIAVHPLSFVGNIGVVMQIYNVSGLAEKIGFKVYTFKSGKLKDMGNPFRALTPEEDELFSGLVGEMQKTFVSRVLESRGKRVNRANLPLITDGRIFSPQHAKKLGLIDEIDTFDGMLNSLTKKLGEDKYSKFTVVEYRIRMGFLNSMFGKFEKFLGVDIEKELLNRRTPELLYLCC